MCLFANWCAKLTFFIIPKGNDSLLVNPGRSKPECIHISQLNYVNWDVINAEPVAGYHVHSISDLLLPGLTRMSTASYVLEFVLHHK